MTAGNSNRAQLSALAWLKWRLLVNALRSGRGAANRVASVLGTLAALALSLLVAAGFGMGAYFLLAERGGGRRASAAHMAHDVATGANVDALFALFGMMSILYLMWATVPLSFGGGSQFDPGRLLLYPISLRKLFLIDLVSELTSLASIFAAPSIFALALGAGLARGVVVSALVVASCATLFGMTLAKLLATLVGTLMQMKRARGEALLAFIGVIGALSGLALGQGAHWLSRFDDFPEALRFTPPGAVAVALAGDAATTHYGLSLLVLLIYTVLAILATYAIARRALQGGGRKRAQQARIETRAAGAQIQGWQLPFFSAELSTVFEKELRYAVRNAQLRTMALMPIIMTVSFKLIGMRRDGARTSTPLLLSASIAPYAEGSGAALSVLYAFLLTSALSSNLFGYEASGMRAYVLAPVARRTILAGKNLAMALVSFVFALAVTLVNALAYRELSWRGLGFTALCFVFFAAASASVGNWFSLRFPKRLQFGKRMNASGVAGLLLLPVFIGIAAPPALAVLAGYAAKSLFVEYVILALFAGAGVVVYFLFIERQGRMLVRRELDILEIVAGRDDD
ncbi:MAG: hypothetical protein ACR2G4_04365 [Pyrinomonadaceae bacterium]